MQSAQHAAVWYAVSGIAWSLLHVDQALLVLLSQVAAKQWFLALRCASQVLTLCEGAGPFSSSNITLEAMALQDPPGAHIH